MAGPQDGYWPPLSRVEVIKAVERQRPARIPLVRAKWWGEGLIEQYGERLQAFDRYPEDVVQLWIEPIRFEEMGLSWEFDAEGSHDSRCVIDDWARLDEFIEKLPDPWSDPQFEALIAQAEEARAQDRYILFSWWRLFFERPWGIRGMTNLLMDYHIYPEHIHRLHDALCTLYGQYLARAVRDLQPDGFWTSDDLGHQKQLFMSPDTFRALIKPYYRRIGAITRQYGLHWWLHSCGNNTEILEDLIEVGVNVFHPVQKHTMDEVTVARDYGDRMVFLVGLDVQHVLQEKDPDGIRNELRFLVDIFDRPDGGMCIAAGNGIVSGTPFENIEAFLDEAVRYGSAHRAQFAAGV